MAACPVSVTPPSSSRRRRLVLTQRRIDANRSNARRSTGPRTREGKARVATNAIKHGFFAAMERWSASQQRDFAETFLGLCDDFRPTSRVEEALVASIADSYVRMAAVLRYESIAAYEYHQHRDRELDARIAAASPTEAARLHEYREKLRSAGLWEPTIPGERDANIILRLLGRLERDISYATSRLRELKNEQSCGISLLEKLKKQSHSRPESSAGLNRKIAKTNPFATRENSQNETESAILTNHENEKTNPLSSMIQGNRHERRRAKALLRRRT